MSKIGLLVALSVWFGSAVGQQLPQYSQFFLNKFILNPGATGTEDHWEAQLINRLQWVGITDAPRTHILSANGPVDENMGLVARAFSDITGPTRRTGFSFSYSYQIQLSKTLKLGMGIRFGGLHYVTDASQILVDTQGDVVLSGMQQSTFVPDAGAGFHLYDEQFYIGVSAPQILGNELKFFDNYSPNDASLSRHFFGYTGYKFEIMDDWVLEPAIMVKWVHPTPLSLDMNMRILYKEVAWAGFSYRMNDAMVVMAGFTINESLIFAYSFDMPTSGVKTVTSGSHEVMIGIRFGKQKASSNLY